VGFKVFSYNESRGVSFRPMSRNNTYTNETNQMMTLPAQRNIESAEDDDGSEVSYDEDDMDYETHLRKIT
jgi:hypothetical protein